MSSASASVSVSSNKRARKANYVETEIQVLLDEIMLARGVLFGSFNDQLTMQEKNRAWDRVTSAVNSCGIAKRSRLEVKEKWKTIKSEVIGRQRRAAKTGGGPAEPAVPYEDSVMQIIGAESNLLQGVAVPDASSFVGPSAVTASTTMTQSATADEEVFPSTPSQADCAISTSFTMGQCIRPICSSTPLPEASPAEPILMSAPFSLPADVSSAVVFTDLQHGNVTVTPDPAASARRTSPARRPSRCPISRRSRPRSTTQTPGDKDERVSFINFLDSFADERKSKTKLMDAQTLLVEAQHRRELLEIAKLERELGNSA